MIEQHNSLGEKFLKKGFWLYLFSFIIAPTWYIIKVILSWELWVDEIWILYWVMSLMVLLSSFNDLGMTESLNKFIPDYITQKKYKEVKAIMLYSLWVQTLTWFIIFCIFYFGAASIAESYFKTLQAKAILQVFAVYFLWINFFQVLGTFFWAVQNTFCQKITEMIRMFFVLFIVIFLFFFDLWNIYSYSWSWVIWMYAWIISSFLYFYYYYYKKYLYDVPIMWDKELFIKLLKYGSLVFLGSQAGTLLSQVDMQMIIYMLGATDAWYYSNYLGLISIPFMIIGPIFSFMFPVFSELNAKNENHKIRMIKQVFQKNFVAVGLAFNLIFFIFATQISYVFFGEKFYMSWVILQYSILFLIFNFLLQLNFSILAALWKVKTRLVIILIGLFINIITNYFLIQTLWVVWSALATWVGWLIIWIISEIILTDYKIKPDFIYLGKNILLLSILWYILFLIKVYFFINLWRLETFFILWGVSILYFWIFLFWNKKDFMFLIHEVKRLRK